MTQNSRTQVAPRSEHRVREQETFASAAMNRIIVHHRQLSAAEAKLARLLDEVRQEGEVNRDGP